eukprot:TRINITY_DN12644_c0_g2_i1.p2 TRINITY_DN12644_c0_g2~~TRINITY_DN12644_c0_g2_i1.p2  ORF type:complete len:336 (+),score=131.09 TRINITY_DN12644_c0_g2_i1:79-1008(+)
MGPREIGCVYECAVCRGHAVCCVAVMDPSRFKTRPGWPEKPQDQQQEWLLEQQQRLAERKYVFLPCPFCVVESDDQSWRERVKEARGWSGDWAEWLQFGPGSDRCGVGTPLTPCRWVEYEEGAGPPLFINDAPAHGGKTKWVLCEGVGPKTLELTRARSGAVYKKCYRGYGLPPAFADCVEAADEDRAAYRSGAVARAIPLLQLLSGDADAMGALFDMCPLARRWDELEPMLAVLAEGGDEAVAAFREAAAGAANGAGDAPAAAAAAAGHPRPRAKQQQHRHHHHHDPQQQPQGRRKRLGQLLADACEY